MLKTWTVHQTGTHPRHRILSVPSFAPSATVWPQFQCKVMSPNSTSIWSLMFRSICVSILQILILILIVSHFNPWFRLILFLIKFLSLSFILGGGVRVGLPRRSKIVAIEISSPHSYSTYRDRYTLHLAPFGHKTQRGRQTDRQSDGNRPPMLSAT